MAHVIKPKARAAESGAPPANVLEDGEIAVNIPERTIFIRSGGAVVPIANFTAELGPVQWSGIESVPAPIGALAGVTLAANRGLYATSASALAAYTLTAGGRALGGVAGTANTFPYFSASNAVTLQAITAAGRALLDDADAAAQRATLGLGTAAALDAADVARVNTGASAQVQASDLRHDFDIAGSTEVRFQLGIVRRRNANSSIMTPQPRFFIQPDDPGDAAADGDVWMW